MDRQYHSAVKTGDIWVIYHGEVKQCQPYKRHNAVKPHPHSHYIKLTRN